MAKIKPGQGGGRAAEVFLKDDESGVESKWQTVPLTRSVKTDLYDLKVQSGDVIKESVQRDADSPFSPEEEEKLVRIACDQISLLTTPVVPSDGPELGDALLNRWLTDQMLDGEISDMLKTLETAAGKQSVS